MHSGDNDTSLSHILAQAVLPAILVCFNQLKTLVTTGVLYVVVATSIRVYTSDGTEKCREVSWSGKRSRFTENGSGRAVGHISLTSL
jgi:hypothetical protein